MASSLNESNLERRLQTVTNTQESIQTLSLWCLHHKAHYKKIIEAWMKVMKKAKSGHRLALFYLANDVIQNSKRKNVNIFTEPWMGALKQATTLVKHDKIKTQIERIFKVWGDRNVYDSTFITELQELLAVEAKSQVSADEKILADFKPQKMIDKIKKHKKLETEVNMKQTQLSNLKVDVCSTESLRQLKDKAHGTKFTKEFEEATLKLEEFVQILEKQQQERTALIEILEKGEIFYNTQRKEAKIVANAYKNFGARVTNLKQKLEEKLPHLSSPVPSPTFDAPSPEDSSAEGSPVKNENKDNIEAVDMEMSDDETDTHGNTKTAPAVALPLESPASPDGSPITNITTPNTNADQSTPAQISPVPDIGATPGTPSSSKPTITAQLTSATSTPPSSLDLRLSSLMQNLPAFTTGIQGSFLNPNSGAVPSVNSMVTLNASAPSEDGKKEITAVTQNVPLRTIPLPPPVGGPNAAMDGAETPVKDEESGTGSATPLQDEEREAVTAINRTDGQTAMSEFLKKLSSSLSSATANRSPLTNQPIGAHNAWDQMLQATKDPSRSTWFPDSPTNNLAQARPSKPPLDRQPLLPPPPPLPDLFFSGFPPMQRPVSSPNPATPLQPKHQSYDYNGSAMDGRQYPTNTPMKRDEANSVNQGRPKNPLLPPIPPPPLQFSQNVVEVPQGEQPSVAPVQPHAMSSEFMIPQGPYHPETSDSTARNADSNFPMEGRVPSNLKTIQLIPFPRDGELHQETVEVEVTTTREDEGEKVSKIETLDSRREEWDDGWDVAQNAERQPRSSNPEWRKGQERRPGQYPQPRFPGHQRNFAPRHDFPQKRSWDNFSSRGGNFGPPPKRPSPRSNMFRAPRPRWRPPYTNRY